MSTFQNLGDLIRRDRDLDKIAIIDLGADWAMIRKTGRGVPTIDLRVDYHAAALPGDLTVKGKIVRMGGQFSTAEAQVLDKDGKLLASGRGTYFTAPPKS